MKSRTGVLLATAALAAVVVAGIAASLLRPPPPDDAGPGAGPLESPATVEVPRGPGSPAPIPEPSLPSEPDATLEPYSGKYAGDPAFKERVDRLMKAVPVAVARVRAWYSLGGGPAPTVRVRLQDAGDSKPGYTMMVSGESRRVGAVQVLTVVSEYLAVDSMDVPTVLLHEMTHAWQGHLLGWPKTPLPRWLEEGLAEWACAEGEEDRIRTFCSVDFRTPEEPRAILDRWHTEFLSGDTKETSGYAYALLAVRCLRLCAPRGDGDAFLRRLLVGKDGISWEEEIFRTTGMRFPEFAARLRPWAEKQVRVFLLHREEYRGARELWDLRKWEEASFGYEGFLRRHPVDAFAPRAMYELAVCRFMARDFEGSLRRLDALEKEWPHTESDAGIAKYRFLIAVETGDRERALALGTAILRDYSYLKESMVDLVHDRMEKLRRTPR